VPLKHLCHGSRRKVAVIRLGPKGSKVGFPPDHCEGEKKKRGKRNKKNSHKNKGMPDYVIK